VDVVALEGGDAAAGPYAEAGADAEGGADANAGSDAAVGPDADAGGGCDPTAAASIVFAQKTDGLWRYFPATGKVTALGQPNCLQTDVAGVAVGTDGLLWVADQNGTVFLVDPTVSPPVCRGKTFVVSTSAGSAFIAFLPPPAGAAPPLYVFQAGQLVVFDSRTFTEAPVGPLDGTNLVGLSGTADGRLYALRIGAQPNGVAISLVNPGDGTVLTTTSTTLLSAKSFFGGAYWGSDFYLFADLFVYVLHLATGVVSGPSALGIPSLGILAVGAAPCPAP
jgi:hypothetical protein